MKTRQRRTRRSNALELLAEARKLYGMSGRTPSLEAAMLRSALIKAKRSLLLDPENCETLVLLGHIYDHFDDRESVMRAIKYYEQAIAIHPDCSDAYIGKADVLLFDLNRPDEAERFARRGLGLALRDNEEPEFLESKYADVIGLLEAREKFKEARWLIREAVKKCPSEFMKGLAESTLKRIGGD